MNILISLYFSAAEVALSLAGLVLLMVCAFAGDKAGRIVTILTVTALFGALAYTTDLLTNPAFELGGDGWGGVYRLDAFGSFAKILIFLATIGVLIVTPSFFDAKAQYRPEYPVLVLFAAVGMALMVSAVDLMQLYLGLELMSLSGYVLASFSRSEERSAEAGLKYFVLGALASGILLYGMSLIYGFTESTNYLGIRAALDGGVSNGALFGIVFVLAGLAFKVAAVPFHMWTPDVYEGAPTPVTAFFSTAPKVAAVAILMRMALDPFGAQSAVWQQIVMFMALASIIFGALGAIGQENLKRLLAYSSINNIGFILLGLAVANPDGASAMLVYLFIYVAMSLGSFVALLMLRGEGGTLFETFADIRGLSVTQPFIAGALLVFMFSLAGIPPLLGFYAKFVVFQATVEAGLVAFGAIAIAASVIGAFYYIKFVKVMFFDEPADVVTGKSGAAHWVLLGLTAAIVSPLGYLLTPSLTEMADKASATLFLAV
jgi:NADH-quinone oxidoreductase subunit N